MNVRLQSYLTKNENGDNIFKMEMENLDCAPWLKFSCDIEIEYNKHPEMRKLIAELISADVTPEAEMNIVQHILAQVTTIEGIRNCKRYESTTMLESDDIQKYQEELLDFAMKSTTEPYTPFSLTSNPNYFKRFIKKLRPFIPYLEEADRSHFEETIAGHADLEEEYIQQFSKEAVFYVVEVPYGRRWVKFYIMKTEDIKIFFYTDSE